MANDWQIRFESTGVVTRVDSPARVLDGLKTGEWEVSDEVKGPDDTDWRALQDHATFADALSDLEPPHVDPPDETRLDMNPLIDVALVLLIFFILTTTYSSLRRSIDIPPEPEDKKGQENRVRPEDIKDLAFNVVVWMEGETPRIRIEDKVVDVRELERSLTEQVRAGGKRQIILAVEGKVPWGVEAAVHDAAKAAEINQIYRKKYKPAP